MSEKKKSPNPILKFLKDLGYNVLVNCVSEQITNNYKYIGVVFFMTLQGAIANIFTIAFSIFSLKAIHVDVAIEPVTPVTVQNSLIPGYFWNIAISIIVIEFICSTFLIYMENSYKRYRYCSLVRAVRCVVSWITFLYFTLRELIRITASGGEWRKEQLLPLGVSFVIFLVLFIFGGNIMNTWLYRIQIFFINEYEHKKEEKKIENAQEENNG